MHIHSHNLNTFQIIVKNCYIRKLRDFKKHVICVLFRGIISFERFNGLLCLKQHYIFCTICYIFYSKILTILNKISVCIYTDICINQLINRIFCLIYGKYILFL